MPADGAGWDEENPWEGLQSGQFGCCSVAKSSLTFKREFCWNFSGGLVVKVLCLQCRGVGSILGWGTKTPYATRCGPKKGGTLLRLHCGG